MKKKLLFAIFALLFGLVLPQVSHAQEPCAEITNVSVNVSEVESSKPFVCSVTVGSEFAQSRDIACGISFNDSWPQDFCPSASHFGGWQGNTGQFNCIFPNTNIPKTIEKVELVAFDFRPSCGPQTGKKIPLKLKTPPDVTQFPEQAPEGQDPAEALIDFLINPLGGAVNVPANPPTGDPNTTTPAPTTAPNANIPVTNGTFTSLRQVLDTIGGKVGVPPRILEAIAYLEYTPTFSLSPQVIAFSTTPGNLMPNCPHNQCSAVGPMQMTIGIDERGSTSCSRCCWGSGCNSSCPNAWASYGRAASIYENTPNYTPLACNMRDNIYGAAMKLKTDAQAANSSVWTRAEVNRAGTRYFGDCTVPIREGRTYCDFMWWYYTN